MNPHIKEFLENNAELLKNENFEQIYRNAFSDIDSKFPIRDLTRVFTSAGINPLDYLTHVPPLYSAGEDRLVNLIIPSHIVEVRGFAYSECYNLESVILSEGVTTLNTAAFRVCKKLTTVTLPKSLRTIYDRVFAWCPKLEVISYPGTVEEFLKISYSPNILVGSNLAIIQCSDGKLRP